MEKVLYINGEWTGSDLKKIEVLNPANGELVGTVASAGKEETRAAIEAAHEAFGPWSRLTSYDRSAYLDRLYDLMIEQKEEIAEIMTKEMGKPLKESLGEVQYAASFIQWYSEEGKRVYGRSIPASAENKRMQVIKQPVGVVAAITPWNFPAAMITRKLGPALAAGCTFIVKPPKETPLTAIKLVELCEKAGFPKGVVNLLTGPSSVIAEQIMDSDKVKKVTFTGSTEVGKMLIEQSARTVKNVSMELGGHAPSIVLDDADLDKAVKGIVASKFRNAGQTCICINRVYVHESIYEEFIKLLVEATRKLKVGNGMDEATDIGPIINRDGYEKIKEHVDNAVEKGAACVLGGKGKDEGNACFYEPTVLKDVNHDMLIMNEETFGPVLPVQKINSDEEGIRLANSSPFGLAAYVYTESMSRGTRLIEGLDYGIIGWNDGVPSAAQAPFGGFKESGIGREGGTEGMEAYLETKYVSIVI
ncbi:NAD-dependent succinate-semialdehyde dehydrogenase [Fictibacillus sp. KIGAM418]|uniref:NAD-dependent succinate-semialdehyde dehydrogenase n=1 Tax=Fictibacillus marinisediminis TaxID=2878389 RepID=A0A9X2BGM6_9BACL|nr:NAD-dependent succinate-semialdehyde dehydrogenase [Fictibacillus marinisediminis]MCK6256678.1 NAD-dependent succinate-semialdehyde dehydrogenase [Fictibacillus marinisediminis]